MNTSKTFSVPNGWRIAVDGNECFHIQKKFLWWWIDADPEMYRSYERATEVLLNINKHKLWLKNEKIRKPIL